MDINKNIRVNLSVEPDADAILFEYLKDVPPRRRATLVRQLATQALSGGNVLKAGVTNNVGAVTPNNAIIKESESVPDAKRKELGNALDDI
ncbi:MAG: hypothetical protein ACXW0T_02380 [Methylobacter sp.]|jgi:hypothetical protein